MRAGAHIVLQQLKLLKSTALPARHARIQPAPGQHLPGHSHDRALRRSVVTAWPVPLNLIYVHLGLLALVVIWCRGHNDLAE
jgi:hypothetical protein